MGCFTSKPESDVIVVYDTPSQSTVIYGLPPNWEVETSGIPLNPRPNALRQHREYVIRPDGPTTFRTTLADGRTVNVRKKGQ